MRRKTYYLLVGIDIMQIVLELAVLVYVRLKGYDTADVYLILAVSLLLLCGILMLAFLYVMPKDGDRQLLQSIEELEALNLTLRAQRHDYLNHFQVVYGLMELGEFEEAKKYLAPVYKDILKVGKALKTSKPAVNALLQAKLAEAEEKGIDLYLEVRTDLACLSMESWNLCKILSNLIDNAIRAVYESDEREKKVEVQIAETAAGYEFCIRNNGPGIPEQMRKEIFCQGVTTKKESGHGMGLYIVQKILLENDGSIEVSSTGEKTCFRAVIPKEGI